MPLVCTLNSDELSAELDAYEALAPIIEAVADEADRVHLNSFFHDGGRARRAASSLFCHHAMRLKPFEAILNAPAPSEKVN